MRIRAMIRPTVVSAPMRVTSISKRPLVSMVPAATWSPMPTSTGTDSPVSEDMSRLALPARTTPSTGTRSPASNATRSPTRSRLADTSSDPSGSKRRALVSASLPRARTASCVPSRLRSSSTWPMVITIGSTAAVIRSPAAQAANNASATSRSAMPCSPGWRRLCQALISTGTATRAAARDATRLARRAPSGAKNSQAIATTSNPADSIASVNCAPSSRRSVRANNPCDRLSLMASLRAESDGCRLWGRPARRCPPDAGWRSPVRAKVVRAIRVCLPAWSARRGL